MTTLHLPPGTLAVLLLLGLGATVFAALALTRPRRPDRPAAIPPEAQPALLLLVGLTWAVLFLMTLAAAFSGVAGAVADPGTAGLGLGGLLVALLGAPFLIWTTWLKHRTVEFQKEGHMTDRISKAVEQLGAEKTVDRIGRSLVVVRDDLFDEPSERRPSRRTLIEWKGEAPKLETDERVLEPGEWKVFSETVPNLEVRIGAILSLERIAQDNTRHDKGRDHVRVMEILSAYIRHNAPAKDAKDHPFGEWEPLPDDATAEQREAREVERKKRFGFGIGNGQVTEWARSLAPPRADIAEALKVLGRRSRDQLLVEAAWPHPPEPGTAWPFDNAPHLLDEPGEAAITPWELDAFKKRLSKWTVGTRNYPGHRLDLRGTNLQRADLSNGWFQGAKFQGARLEGTDLNMARFEGADLSETRLDGANLLMARLNGAKLGKARLEGTILWGANLQGTDFTEAQLEGTDLMHARFQGADLSEARLDGTNLMSAGLEGTTLMLSHGVV